MAGSDRLDKESQRPDIRHLRELLRAAMSTPETCIGAVDAFEQLLKSIWDFSSRLLGAGGARAIIGRALVLASPQAPLLKNILVSKDGTDFSQLRAYVRQAGCDASDVIDSFVYLGEMIFFTLSDLTGDLVTTPLLKYLEEWKQNPGDIQPR